MNQQNPPTTIQDLITCKIKEKNLSRHQLATSLGYTNISKGLRRLESFMLTLEGPEEFIQKLTEVLGIDAISFHKSMINSLDIMEKNANDEKKERFSPYINILINFTNHPLLFVRQYMLFHCATAVPPIIQQLPFQEELNAVFGIYEKHLDTLSVEKFAGGLLQYLKPTEESNEEFRELVIGFRYYRSFDHTLHFSPDFKLCKIEYETCYPKKKGALGNKVYGMMIRSME